MKDKSLEKLCQMADRSERESVKELVRRVRAMMDAAKGTK